MPHPHEGEDVHRTWRKTRSNGPGAKGRVVLGFEVGRKRTSRPKSGVEMMRSDRSEGLRTRSSVLLNPRQRPRRFLKDKPDESGSRPCYLHFMAQGKRFVAPAIVLTVTIAVFLMSFARL